MKIKTTQVIKISIKAHVNLPVRKMNEHCTLINRLICLVQTNTIEFLMVFYPECAQSIMLSDNSIKFASNVYTQRPIHFKEGKREQIPAFITFKWFVAQKWMYEVQYNFISKTH